MVRKLVYMVEFDNMVQIYGGVMSYFGCRCRRRIISRKKERKIWLKYVANKKMLETYVGTRQNLNFAPKKAHMLGEKYVNVHAPSEFIETRLL